MWPVAYLVAVKAAVLPGALEQAQATADAGFQPKLVREGGAVPTGPGEIEKPAEGDFVLASRSLASGCLMRSEAPPNEIFHSNVGHC